MNNLPFPPSASPLVDRLVTLCDGRSGLRSGLQVEIQEPSNEPAKQQTNGNPPETARSESTPAVLDFIASDETLDRCDEIIAASGWRLEAYRRNPVFQNAHQYGDVIFTLGKAIITEVRLFAGRPALFQRIQFAVEANPMARIAHALYKGRFLNAVSVGFIPLRWENGEAGKKGMSVGCRGSRTQRAAAFSPPSMLDIQHSPVSFRRRYLEQELLEVSAVGIPANPNALQLGLKSGAIAKADLQELAELLRAVANSGAAPETRIDKHTQSPLTPGSATQLSNFRSNPAAADTHARASGVGGHEAQLLQLARDVLEVLRNA